VQVERHVEALEALEQRRERPVVEEATGRVAVDHRAEEAELADRALELVRRGRGIGGRQRGKAREAVGVLAHRRREDVVGVACQRHRGCGVEVLHARRGVADDLQIDPRGVHRRDPPLAEVGEVGAEGRVGAGVGIAQRADRLRDRGRPEVLLQGDDAHGAYLARGARAARPAQAAV
jgi:hypothetical protein